MTAQSADFPVRDDVVDASRKITDRWRIWLRDLRLDVDSRSSVLATVGLDGQNTSITTTPFKTATLNAGQYRVSAFLHVTTVGTVTSSILATISFTHKAIACSLATVALTTNLTTSVSGTVIPFSIDAGTPISWSTTYASNAASTMKYSITLVLESVNG